VIKRLLICSILCLLLAACVSTPNKEIAEGKMLGNAVVLDSENDKVIRPLKPGEHFFIIFFVRGDLTEISARFILRHEGKPVFEGGVNSQYANIEEVGEGIHKVSIPFTVPYSGIPAGSYSVLLIVVNMNTGEIERATVDFKIKVTTEI